MFNFVNNRRRYYSWKLLKILLAFFNLLSFLDSSFNFSVSGQLTDIEFQSSIIVNDKLYFFGGNSKASGYTSQVIYLDLLDQNSQVKPTTQISTIPPFTHTSLTLRNGNSTLYLISGHRTTLVQTPGTTAYGSIVYSINTSSFNTWTSENLTGQSLLNNVTYTIYTQDDEGNVYITGSGVNNMYKLDNKTLSFVSLIPKNSGPNINEHFYTCHSLSNNKEAIIIYIGGNLTQLYAYNIKESNWTTIVTIGDTPSYRIGHSSVLAPDGRIIVYGGYNETITIPDKLIVLNRTSTASFQWTIPKNVIYPIEENHYGHTSNLHGNYMITSFGWIYETWTGNQTTKAYTNILMLDISNQNNYKLLNSYSHPITTTAADIPTVSPYNNAAIIIGSVAATVFTIFLIALSILFVKKSKKSKSEGSGDENMFGDEKVIGTRQRNKKVTDKIDSINVNAGTNIDVVVFNTFARDSIADNNSSFYGTDNGNDSDSS